MILQPRLRRIPATEPNTNQPSRRYAEALDLHEPLWGRPGMRGFSRICGNRGIESAVCPLS